MPSGDPPARELSRLIPGERPDEPTWDPRARSALPKVGALAAGTIVVALILALAGSSTSQFLAQRHTDGGEVALASDEFPWGFVKKQLCGVDFKIVNVVHSNLGNQGPDHGEEGIVYNCTESDNGKYLRNVLVKVNAKSPYSSKSAHMNGKQHDFGSIRVDSGKTVEVRFSVWSMKEEPVTAKIFRVTFYDLDEGPHGTSREFIIADDMTPDAARDKDTEVITKRVHGDQEFLASHQGSGADNPDDSKHLTGLQRDRSVVLEYKDVHYFDTTLGSSDGHSPRNFAFALHSALACHEVKLAITTTFTTTTATTTTPEPGTFPWMLVLAIAAVTVAACGILAFFLLKPPAAAAGLPPGYPVGSS